eukprot:scaffold18714_cov69-Phaeocystis_antarctica.AAC.1
MSLYDVRLVRVTENSFGSGSVRNRCHAAVRSRASCAPASFACQPGLLFVTSGCSGSGAYRSIHANPRWETRSSKSTRPRAPTTTHRVARPPRALALYSLSDAANSGTGTGMGREGRAALGFGRTPTLRGQARSHAVRSWVCRRSQRLF